MKPRRIQLSRKKGWLMPPNTVNVARPSKFGNPFKLAYYRDRVGYSDAFARQTAVDFFRACTFGDDTANDDVYQARCDWIREHVHELRGKNLACWCPLDAPCHADVLLEMANRPQDYREVTNG